MAYGIFQPGSGFLEGPETFLHANITAPQFQIIEAKSKTTIDLISEFLGELQKIGHRFDQ